MRCFLALLAAVMSIVHLAYMTQARRILAASDGWPTMMHKADPGNRSGVKKYNPQSLAIAGMLGMAIIGNDWAADRNLPRRSSMFRPTPATAALKAPPGNAHWRNLFKPPAGKNRWQPPLGRTAVRTVSMAEAAKLAIDEEKATQAAKANDDSAVRQAKHQLRNADNEKNEVKFRLAKAEKAKAEKAAAEKAAAEKAAADKVAAEKAAAKKKAAAERAAAAQVEATKKAAAAEAAAERVAAEKASHANSGSGVQQAKHEVRNADSKYKSKNGGKSGVVSWLEAETEKAKKANIEAKKKEIESKKDFDAALDAVKKDLSYLRAGKYDKVQKSKLPQSLARSATTKAKKEKTPFFAVPSGRQFAAKQAGNQDIPIMVDAGEWSLDAGAGSNGGPR